MRPLTITLVAALALAASPAFAADVCQTPANLVVNCGFETGDFTGWTQSGNTGFTGVSTGIYAYSGNYGAFGGPHGSDGYLSQNVGAPGVTTYYVSFWLEQLSSSGPNDFTVFWNGVDVGPDLLNANAFGYTQIAGALPGNSCAGCNTITFAFSNDTSTWGLDSVFVGTPEPASLLLFGTGALGVAGLIRRKINL
jgi:hypothetical protein